jgi:hypothetical protein
MTLQLPSAVSNPVTLVVGETAQEIEVEPNDEPSKAQTLPVPGITSGRIHTDLSQVAQTANVGGAPTVPAADIGCFRFRATQGQKLILEVIARRYGSELDALLSVTDASGKEVAVNDDGVGVGKDSRLEFTTPETGEYVAQIRDLHDRHGPRFTYQFSITLPTPDFALSFTPDRLAVGPGGRIPMTATAQRLNGFDGEIALEVSDLPAGVNVLGPSRIRAGQKETNLVLAAAPGSVIQTTRFRVTGIATIDGKEVRRAAQGMEEVLRNNQKTLRPVNLLAAAVTETPELTVTATPETVTLPKGGTVEITLKVERKEGSKGKIPLAVLGLPPGVTATAPDIPEDKPEGKITLKTEDRASPGEIEIVVAGKAVIDNQRQVSHVAPPMLLKVTPPTPAAPKEASEKK